MNINEKYYEYIINQEITKNNITFYSPAHKYISPSLSPNSDS